MTSTKARIAPFLEARGWRYIPESDDECGTPSVDGPSGWCPRTAHWNKLYGPTLCATHARIREELADG